MDLAFLPQLQAMLHVPEPPVSDRHPCGVIVGDVPTAHQRTESGEGCGAPHRLVGSSVYKLE
jgi:hypothetical protein